MTFGVRVHNHLHLVAEAQDREALSRGMQGLLVRVARRLNRLWGRKGRVFVDRYHDRILRSPREVRAALGYVLRNARKHGSQWEDRLDPYSSGRWFDGWRERRVGRQPIEPASPVARARTWLLRLGWRRHGLIPLAYVPAGP